MNSCAVSLTTDSKTSVSQNENPIEQKRFLNIDSRIVAAATGALVGLVAMTIFAYANPLTGFNLPNMLATFFIEDALSETAKLSSILLTGGILGAVAGLVRSVVDKRWPSFADCPRIGDAVSGALSGGGVMFLRSAFFPTYFSELIHAAPRTILVHFGASAALGAITMVSLAPVTILAATAARYAISKLVAEKAPA